jgi:branched-subunit amino acid aminotransferase/4-amino-4-deoxychorismate lyase
LQRLDAASEVMALSTIREVQSVVAVGGQTWQPGPITERLARSFARRTLE